MHFFHLSDLHIGKQLYGYSLLEDQEWILTEIYELIREKRPDGVLIAGDVIFSGVTCVACSIRLFFCPAFFG